MIGTKEVFCSWLINMVNVNQDMKWTIDLWKDKLV